MHLHKQCDILCFSAISLPFDLDFLIGTVIATLLIDFKIFKWLYL